MNLIFTINDGYVYRILPLIQSIKVNTRDEVKIYLIYDNVSAKNVKMLIDYVSKISDGRMIFIPVEFHSEAVDQLPVHGKSWSIEVYFRLFAPYLILEDKALYIDGDVIVNGDIAELYDQNIDEYYMAAIPNDITKEHNQRLGLPDDNLYANGGVLLLNLAKIRNDFSEQGIVDILKKNSSIFKFQDQDFINVAFYQKIKYVSNKFNYMINVAEINSTYEQQKDIRICHYVLEKPWDIKFPYKTDGLYFKYLTMEGKWYRIPKLWLLHRMYRLYQIICVPKQHRRI